MQGSTTIKKIELLMTTQNLTHGTQSLSDLQYDTCGVNDSVCAEKVAICSKRPYDPEWMCENEVARDVATYIFKIKQGKVTYLGSTLRGELCYNPGNIAKLTGSAQGSGLLSTVIGIDEYNGGILQSGAPWDMAPAYLCKGTYDPTTNSGMRWQGQGIASMTWISSSLMLCVIPVNMAKTVVGPVVLAFACYGNYNVQMLTTFLNLNKVTSFDATPFRLCGPAMFSSVIAIMSGTAIQMFFNPLLVSPSYILTIVSVVNWIIVFVLEAYVFPNASVMLTRDCALATSTSCSYFSASQKSYYPSPLIGACTIGLGILVVFVIRYRAIKRDLPLTNSVLKLFHAKTVRMLATSGAGGCIVSGPDGTMLVDSGILLNKNLVRVSSTVLVRSCIVKYVIIYRLLPGVLARSLSRAVGVTLVIKAPEDRVLRDIAFLQLTDMKLETGKHLPGYYS